MTNTKEPSHVTQLIVTDPLDTHPELLEGALLLAYGLAQTQSLSLGINAAEPLRSALLVGLPAQVRLCLAEHGEAVLDAVKLVDLTAEDQVASFTGIHLFIGADAVRLEVLRQVQGAPMVVVVPQTEAELQAVDTAYPYAGHAHLNVQSEMPKLSESQKSRVQWFDDRYDQLKAQHFNPQSDIVKLGEGQAKICRYCNETKDSLFSNISHAFPEQIGNKKLVDLLECDSCNKHFATMVDDHFGKWSLPTRSTGRIKGKKNKVPSYRSADQKFRIDYRAGGLKIEVREGDERVKFNSEAKEMQLQFERQPYVPMAIFKSFVKMALAVMPEPEANECAHLKNWILETTHTFESFPYKPLILFTQFVPGPLPNDKVTYCVLRRKAGISDCPYLLFVLQYANNVYQIALPMPLQDVPEGLATVQLSYFPHPWDTPEHERQFGRMQLFQTDLSSPDVKKGELFPMSFAFDSAVETTPKDPN